MSNELVSNQDLIISNMLQIEALVRILTIRGITNEDEILKEVEQLKIEMNEKIRKMSKEN